MLSRSRAESLGIGLGIGSTYETLACLRIATAWRFVSQESAEQAIRLGGLIYGLLNAER